VELPQWSPDGKQIAYMASRLAPPWRINIVDVETGKTREASEGNDSQGAPNWSPDGKFLSYGGVDCEETNSCAIHRINLITGKVQTLPDSDGLYSARWSPDGRFIAALHLEQHRLLLFDVKSEKWRELADGVNGTDLSWSSNSKYLYFDVPGEARIVRIRVADGQQEVVLSFRAQDEFNLSDVEDLQFSVGPDDAVITHRQISSPEIFAYDVRDH
jgi:Tol biopolymer transport system component